MAKPAIMMMQNMAQSQNGGAPIPGMDHIEQAVDEIGFLVSLQYGYEGSSFCKGEIFAHEIAKFVLNTGRKEAAKFFPMLDPDFSTNWNFWNSSRLRMLLLTEPIWY